MNALPEAIIERTFDARPELVWRIWTEPALLQQWYGPKVETTIHRFDLEPGGTWLNEMTSGAGSKFQKIVFQEISAPERMVWLHHSNTDDQWQDTPIAWMRDWPRVIRTGVSFEADGDTTRLRLTQAPHDATDAEIAFFARGMDGLESGWEAGFAIIDQLLQDLQLDS